MSTLELDEEIMTSPKANMVLNTAMRPSINPIVWTRERMTIATTGSRQATMVVIREVTRIIQLDEYKVRPLLSSGVSWVSGFGDAIGRQGGCKYFCKRAQSLSQVGSPWRFHTRWYNGMKLWATHKVKPSGLLPRRGTIRHSWNSSGTLGRLSSWVLNRPRNKPRISFQNGFSTSVVPSSSPHSVPQTVEPDPVIPLFSYAFPAQSLTLRTFKLSASRNADTFEYWISAVSLK